MKKTVFIATIVLSLWACNGAGRNIPVTTDSSGRNMHTDSGMDGARDSLHVDSIHTSGMKPDSTMRQ